MYFAIGGLIAAMWLGVGIFLARKFKDDIAESDRGNVFGWFIVLPAILHSFGWIVTVPIILTVALFTWLYKITFKLTWEDIFQ